MMKKILTMIVVLLCIGLSAVPSTGTVVEKKFCMSTNYGDDILYVGGNGSGNYTKIQDAIDNSSDGDTVFVYNGTYYENVIVHKSINLIGENKETTIIDGQKKTVVKVTEDDVTIAGFSITNALDSPHMGIWADKVDGCIFSNNIIYSNYYGISLSYSSNNIITNNKILDNTHGIELFHSSNNIISDSIISNDSIGIITFSSNNNNITCNKISNCFFGILLAGKKNIIEKNNFIGNKRDAIFSYFWRNILIKNYWDSNYWDKWIGFGPKLIFGRIESSRYIPWINFDWHPARQPYNIGV